MPWVKRTEMFPNRTLPPFTVSKGEWQGVALATENQRKGTQSKPWPWTTTEKLLHLNPLMKSHIWNSIKNNSIRITGKIMGKTKYSISMACQVWTRLIWNPTSTTTEGPQISPTIITEACQLPTTLLQQLNSDKRRQVVTNTSMRVHRNTSHWRSFLTCCSSSKIFQRKRHHLKKLKVYTGNWQKWSKNKTKRTSRINTLCSLGSLACWTMRKQ